MKNKIIAAFITLLSCSLTPAFAGNDCVAFSNFSPYAAEIEPIPSPGGGTIVQPKATVLLYGDAMGLCMEGKCMYDVRVEEPYSFTGIDNVPPGSHIIYGGKDLYYVDKNTHVEC
jgi:hypothetical protein